MHNIYTSSNIKLLCLFLINFLKSETRYNLNVNDIAKVFIIVLKNV